MLKFNLYGKEAINHEEDGHEFRIIVGSKFSFLCYVIKCPDGAWDDGAGIWKRSRIWPWSWRI